MDFFQFHEYRIDFFEALFSSLKKATNNDVFPDLKFVKKNYANAVLRQKNYAKNM